MAFSYLFDGVVGSGIIKGWLRYRRWHEGTYWNTVIDNSFRYYYGQVGAMHA